MLLLYEFCEDQVSVVRRPCVRLCVNNFFKQLPLQNYLARFGESLQGCSLHEALPKLFKELKLCE